MTEVIEKTENKKGYKKTKLGWIPEDWEVVKLGNIATEINDKVGTKQRTPMSLSAGKGFVAQAKKFGKDIAGKQYAQYTCLPPRTFAYNKGNSLKYPQGCIYQQPFNEEVAVPNVFICFALDKKRCNNNFYEQLFKNNAQGKELFKYINSGVRNDGLLNLNDNNFFKIKLVLPPLNEQEKIAEILSAWDDGIETLEKLIEQKEIFHKALMKNLLIGKIRLSGYNSKWTHSKFNSIFERITRKNEELNSNILTISAQNGLISQKDFYNKRIASVDTSKYILLKNGEFAYNKSYSNGYPLGAIKRLDLYEKGVVSSLYICFKLNNSDNCSDFWKYYFEAGMLNREIKMIAQEGARNHGLLNMATEDFFNMLLYHPKDSKEQQKIAEILNKSDKEIQLLNSKLEKLKEQKKGLMQKLLTGQIRVKV